MKEKVGSTLDLSTKACFHRKSTNWKIWVENSVFAFQHIEKRKSFTEVLPPPPPPRDQTNPFAYSCSFTFHTSYKNGMIGHGGKRSQNAQKHFSIKAFKKLIMYTPVGKYQFAMACIRALVMSAYKVINCLSWDSSFKHQMIG